MPVTAPRFEPAALSLLDEDHAAGRRIGVAVSGGGDSTALLVLLADRYGPGALSAATVDHGLRPEAAEEAATVADLCGRLGVRHATLRWQGWDGRGNLQDAARRARYGLLADWAAGAGSGSVALGHTSDDDAETFVMGLARGAGLDGLSGMRPVFRRGAVRFARPLLGQSRAALRALLEARGIGWIDEPSNEDPRFERVRVREVLAGFDALGIAPERIARSIANLRDTRAAIAGHLAGWSADHVALDRGDLVLDRAAFAALAPDFARRILVAGLRWISGADHPPRGDAVGQALQIAASGGRIALHGCLVSAGAQTLRLSREPEAAGRAAPAAVGAVWDGRWRVTGPEDGEVRALTAGGLAGCPGWRDTGLPRQSLAASPAVWAGDRLLAAPLAGLGAGWRAELAQGRDVFADALTSR